LIRKQEVVVNPTNKGKTKEQKVDQVTKMDRKWVKTWMKKMIYKVVARRVEHPTLT
jgi:hypothetical protein